MVGDRVHDVVGARENDVACIAVGWGYGSRDELESAGPDAIVESVSELLACLCGPGGYPGNGEIGADPPHPGENRKASGARPPLGSCGTCRSRGGIDEEA